MCSTMVRGVCRLAAIGGWQLATGGWWRLVGVGGGWWRLVVGDWWLVAVGNGWRRLAIGGPLGRSLRVVLNKNDNNNDNKKSGSLRTALLTSNRLRYIVAVSLFFSR